MIPDGIPEAKFYVADDSFRFQCFQPKLLSAFRVIQLLASLQLMHFLILTFVSLGRLVECQHQLAQLHFNA